METRKKQSPTDAMSHVETEAKNEVKTKTEPPVNIFDLKPTINWIKDHREKIEEKLDWIKTTKVVPSFSSIRGRENLHLSVFEINVILQRFPWNSHKRSVFDHIVGCKPTWFKQGTKAGEHHYTHRIEESMSPTDIVPGLTKKHIWTFKKKLEIIELYAIPGVDPAIGRIVQIMALIHEFARTLVDPLLTGDKGFFIEFPKNNNIDYIEFFEVFAHESNRYDTAISCFAETYRPIPHKFNDPEFKIRVSEELCEYITAYITGFVYCNDPKRFMDPFHNRSFMKLAIKWFLEADVIENFVGSCL